MFNGKKIIGVTGVSVYSEQVHHMIESELNACIMYINQDKIEDLEWACGLCDHFVLPGGRDLFYGNMDEELATGVNFSNFSPERDLREKFIYEHAEKYGKRMLLICRNHQGYGVFKGLHLISDISSGDVCHNPSWEKIELNNHPAHFLYIEQENKSFPFQKSYINSFHHQALFYRKNYNYAKNGINVIGWSYVNHPSDKNKDGLRIIELMENTEKTVISCQNHPELDYKTNVASRAIIERFKEMIA